MSHPDPARPPLVVPPSHAAAAAAAPVPLCDHHDDDDDDDTPASPPPTLERAMTMPAKTPVHKRSYLRIQPSEPATQIRSPTAAPTVPASARTPAHARIPGVHSSLFRSPAGIAPSRSFSSFASLGHSPLSCLDDSNSHPHLSHRPPLTHTHAHAQHAQRAVERTRSGVTQTTTAQTPKREQSSLFDAHPSNTAAIATVAESSSSVVDDSPPILSLALPAHILVGPVIGKVTTSTARILLEVDSSISVTARLTPQTRWFRPKLPEDNNNNNEPTHTPLSDKRKDVDGDTDEHISKKVKLTSDLSSPSPSPPTPVEPLELNHPDPSKPIVELTKSLHAFVPSVFHFSGLLPDTIYLVEFVSPHLLVDECADSTGLFVTFSPDPTRTVRFIAFSCDCASEVGRGSENMWKKLYRKACVGENGRPEFDVCLHIGDQVYADAAFAKGEIIFGVAEPDATTTPHDEAAAAAAEAESNSYAHLSVDEKCALVYAAYAEIYRHTWMDSPTRLVLACGSHIMIWDDHELRNDWGSFQSTPIDVLIASQARKAFHLYQRQLWDESIDPYQHPMSTDGIHTSVLTSSHPLLPPATIETNLHIFGEVGVLIMDNRACKTWDDTSALFPNNKQQQQATHTTHAEQMGIDQPAAVAPSNGDADDVDSLPLIPHGHAYFGARQWRRLYELFPSAPTSSSPPPPTSLLRILLIVNPSPAFFLGSRESARLSGNTCLLDKLGLGLHPEEQAAFLDIFTRWKDATCETNGGRRQILFVGGDSHFGMHTTLWRVTNPPTVESPASPPSSSPSSSSSLCPSLVGSGSVHGPAHGPVPAPHTGVRVVAEQVLASALSSRRPKYTSFELWKQSLWKDHTLIGNTNDMQEAYGGTQHAEACGSTVASSASIRSAAPPLGPIYLTHTNLLYAHNYVSITCNPRTSDLHWKYVISDAHKREMQIKRIANDTHNDTNDATNNNKSS